MVTAVHARDEVPMYTLKSLDQSKTIRGRFYREELRKLKPGDARGHLEVEKILSQKKRKGVEYVKVKYKNLEDPAFITWVKKSNVVLQ